MNRRYIDLINQSFDFPQGSFRTEEGNLYFNDIPLKEVVDRFGSPLKLTYLPRIGEQIQKARTLFDTAIKKYNYQADYIYTYCTKSSHFAHITRQTLTNGGHLELSSAFDTNIIFRLFEKGLLDKNIFIVCNGYKTRAYIQGIKNLIQEGFTNVIAVLDNIDEIIAYEAFDVPQVNLGIRLATEEEPDFDLYTSRFGIRQAQIERFVQERIIPNPKFNLRMLHFFIYTGIKDTIYYWTELNKCIKIYADIKRLSPSLDSLNIGGGMPISNSLSFSYDYEYMTDEIVRQIKESCQHSGAREPHIFTEFGSFTVGESGAMIFKVLGEKRQNDREVWYILNNSLITTLPDIWGLSKKFILLPINKWLSEYQRVILGGLTCDNDDYYSAEANTGQVYLPRIEKYEEPLYLGFFHTGAYQETLGGFGGIQHCLIPSPKHILVDKDKDGNFVYEMFAEEQKADSVLKILGY